MTAIDLKLVTLSSLWRGKVTVFEFSVVGVPMVRKSVRVSSRLILSAALSWTLIPIANADAPTSPPPSSSRSPAAASAPRGDSAYKKLNTIPEDGMGDKEWLGGLTRVAREIMAKRPNEDLIICIAGCVETQDRVVFAQPAEPVRPKPVDMYSDAAPVNVEPAAATSQADQPKPVDAKPAADKPAAEAASVKPASNSVSAPVDMKAPEAAAAPDAQPAIAPAARTTTNETTVPQFVPSASEPKAEAAPETAAPEAKSEGADAAPLESDAKPESNEGTVEPSGDTAEPK